MRCGLCRAINAGST
ncbi:hypothetical protein FCV43_02950 [Vibrio genomosp. F6]|nr:hypothetical protein [Vibrio sp. 03-59-1]RBW66636.1 hypothetical protein DS893_03400 [Vibrionales bacterium C3R12]TKF23945.1 hypothetical protein FCV43_02950 [Vibrio genomosp. F6]